MPTPDYDVAVVGAGIAGLSASVFLREYGFNVVCLDVRPYPHHKVGESLDWSSPGLLQRLGISRERLLAEEIATLKKQIAVHELGRAPWSAAPPPAMRRTPLRFETITLHVDRTALDALIYEQALRAGTTFIWERVSDVHWSGEHVRTLNTTTGRRIDARWFVDATGTARLFQGLPVDLFRDASALRGDGVLRRQPRCIPQLGLGHSHFAAADERRVRAAGRRRPRPAAWRRLRGDHPVR
jgi:flavin-dependent dehydrogenase